jgi:Fe2+ transport system protein FeoA
VRIRDYDLVLRRSEAEGIEAAVVAEPELASHA